MSDYETTRGFAQWAAEAIDNAERLAEYHGFSTTTTPLIFAGLLKTTGGASKLLSTKFGVTEEAVMRVIERMELPDPPRSLGFKGRFTEKGFEVLAKARALSVTHSYLNGMVDRDHLLLALLDVADEPFVTLANRLDLELDGVRVALMPEIANKKAIREEHLRRRTADLVKM